MDHLIPKMYREYGEYVNSYRSFPYEIDGLKPVERRILTVSYLVAKDKLVKSARIDGTTIAKFHPHSSVYGSLVQLVNQGFLIGQGNFGVNLGVEPSPAAASRYTECKLSKNFHDMAFKLIKYVPWVEGEMDDKEPLYLPTQYPICLIGKEYTQGIGFAYRTLIPCYKIDDLKKRLLWLIGKRKNEPTIEPISDCIILSDKNELRQILKTGKGSIKLQGVYETKDSEYEVILKSWSSSKRFEAILSKFKKELDSQDIGFTDISNQKDGTAIVFQVLKQRNKLKIYNNLIKKLKSEITTNQSFEIRVTGTDGKVKLISVDDMLLNTYKYYTKINSIMLKENIQKCENEIKENILIQKITPLLAEYLKDNSDIDIDKVILLISKKAEIIESKVKEIFSKYTIRKLLTFKSDIKLLKEKKGEFKNKINNLENFVLEQY